MAHKPLPFGERNPEIETLLSRRVRRVFLHLAEASGPERTALGIPRALNHHWKTLLPVSALLKHLAHNNTPARLPEIRSNMPKELVFVDVVLPVKGSREPIQLFTPPEEVTGAPEFRPAENQKTILSITYR